LQTRQRPTPGFGSTDGEVLVVVGAGGSTDGVLVVEAGGLMDGALVEVDGSIGGKWDSG